MLAKNPDAKGRQNDRRSTLHAARSMKNNLMVNESHIAIVQLVIRARNNIFKRQYQQRRNAKAELARAFTGLFQT